MSSHSVEDSLRSAAERVTAITEETRRVLAAATVRLRAIGDGATSNRNLELDPIEFDAVLARVRDALAENDFGALRRRDARLVLQRFSVLRVDEARVLLRAYPNLWKVWARRFLAERLDLAAEVERDWVRLLDEAPRELALLDGLALPRAALLMPGATRSAAAVANAAPLEMPLCDVLAVLTQPGLLELRWQYTGLVLAYALARKGRDAGASWKSICEDARLESLLLPRARDDLGMSRAGDRAEHLLSVAPSLEAQAVVLATLLGRAADAPPVFDRPTVRSLYFDSVGFGDPRQSRRPREQPPTPGWMRVRELVPDRYAALIDALVSDDISLFFGTLNIDQDRKHFWQRYASKASSTVFFLSPRSRKLLQERFDSQNADVKQVLRRARKLFGAGGVDAFALRFGHHVVVEFSQTGNAAFLYEAAAFDQIFAQQSLDVSDLKRQDLGERLLHVSHWHTTFGQALARCGIASTK